MFGQAVEKVERDLAATGCALYLDDRVERHEGHAEIRWMRRDAVLAPAQDGVGTIIALDGVASRARRALIAGARRIIEIGAACPLQQISARGRNITELT